MMEPQRPYDLEERLIDFASEMIDLVEQLPDTRVGNHIADQVLRSGTSPAPQYGEAQSAESRNDFVHKMKLGLKELRETKVWLTIVQRKHLIAASPKIDSLLKECDELIRIFAKSISTAESGQQS